MSTVLEESPSTPTVSTSTDLDVGAPSNGDITEDALTKQAAVFYRQELKSQRAQGGKGLPLTEQQMTLRLVRLRRRNAALPSRYRAADAKAIDELESAPRTRHCRGQSRYWHDRGGDPGGR